MMVTYHTMYDFGMGPVEAAWSDYPPMHFGNSVKTANLFVPALNSQGSNANAWARIEMRYNGRWHRPPVGIKSRVWCEYQGKRFLVRNPDL